MPLTRLSFTGLDEFVNKPVVENRKSKEEVSKIVRKNDDALIIEEWVSDSEEENVSQLKTEKKIFKPSIAKIEFVKDLSNKIKLLEIQVVDPEIQVMDEAVDDPDVEENLVAVEVNDKSSFPSGNVKIGALQSFCFSKWKADSWSSPKIYFLVNVNSLTVNHVPKKLHDTDPEITLGELGIQFLIFEQFQDYSQ
ncbi:hypothetical protein Tco_0697458, partial [Tanacetum coccineum]